MGELEITPQEAAERLRMRPPRCVLLDCREPEEWKAAAIVGALQIPMGDIPSRLPTLDPDMDYIVFCHHGVRSLHVARFLRQQDFGSVVSMRGGIDSWAQTVDPAVPRYS